MDPRKAPGPRRQKNRMPPPAQDFQYSQFPSVSQQYDMGGGYAPQYPQQPGMGIPGTGGYEQSYGQPSFPGQQFLADPMASMAMQYGQSIAGQGKQMMEEKLERYVSISKVKHYFAVDTGYVAKKLGLLFFPFTHKEWSVQFNNENEPVAPRFDVNAPDLYIPMMAFVTYILIAGYILGLQSRFSPEQLGMQASSALGWSFIELGILLFALYLASATSCIKILDLVAFCSYKYVSMVAILLGSLSFNSLGYYSALVYCSLSLGFFLIRTLRVLILPKATTAHYQPATRQNSYLLLGISFVQPLLMYILTKHLIYHDTAKEM